MGVPESSSLPVSCLKDDNKQWLAKAKAVTLQAMKGAWGERRYNKRWFPGLKTTPMMSTENERIHKLKIEAVIQWIC